MVIAMSGGIKLTLIRCEFQALSHWCYLSYVSGSPEQRYFCCIPRVFCLICSGRLVYALAQAFLQSSPGCQGLAVSASDDETARVPTLNQRLRLSGN